MKPTRIQRSRVKGATTPANTKYCGRPCKWGNPFVVNQHSANYWRVAMNVSKEEVTLSELCTYLLTSSGPAGFKTKAEAQAHAANLFGKLIDLYPARYWAQDLDKYAHLSCWCALDAPCHVDEIIKRID